MLVLNSFCFEECNFFFFLSHWITVKHLTPEFSRNCNKTLGNITFLHVYVECDAVL